MNRKAIILSISSYKMSRDEESLIKNQKPWGIILFKRNIKSLNQTKELTNRIRFLMNDRKYPILIDEEGGKVSRLSNIIDTKDLSQNLFGNLYEKNKNLGIKSYSEFLTLICQLLNEAGVNINTTPVLDVLNSNAHKIIGSRSYSKNINTINILKKKFLDSLNNFKIGSVSKHIPGHGLSKVDTHKKISVINETFKTLLKKDFKVFKDIKSHFSMTAHIIYNKIDPLNVATHSNLIISEIIRRRIGFKGILISDDISMKALSKNLVYNAEKAISSGCNLVLYCKGNFKESSLLLSKMSKIDNFTKKKTSEFYNFLR